MLASFNLRKVNNLLSLLVVALAAYIILLPLLPAIGWWVRYQAPVISAAPKVDMSVSASENTLLIPSLGMRQTIHEGNSEATLSKGVWRRPQTSTPDKGSNTVLSGHRFTYSGKSVFYYLDKIKTGDVVYVNWEGKQYKYQITHMLEVSPDNGAIEAPTSDSVLTIYTCTPLWSAKNRLVIQAKLVEGRS